MQFLGLEWRFEGLTPPHEWFVPTIYDLFKLLVINSTAPSQSSHRISIESAHNPEDGNYVTND